MMPISDSNSVRQQLVENLQSARARIAAACQRVGRSAADVQLVAVTKYTPLGTVKELVDLGHLALGENRPQQLVQRKEQLANEVHWHLIGQLQRNKVRQVLPAVSLIHSVDSFKLLRHIDRIAGELELAAKVLVQVNVSGEESKSGFSVADLKASWGKFTGLNHLRVTGLMTMAPHTDDEELIRSTFRGLRHLRDDLNSQTDSDELRELSMGMSGDFEIAIEEGATLVRLGSILFQGCDADD